VVRPRAVSRHFTANLGGPVVRNRLWFFAWLSVSCVDYDQSAWNRSEISSHLRAEQVSGKADLAGDEELPRAIEFPLTKSGLNPERPTLATPFETTLRFESLGTSRRRLATLPTRSSNTTLWDARVGRFVSAQENVPNIGDINTPNRVDSDQRYLEWGTARVRRPHAHPNNHQANCDAFPSAGVRGGSRMEGRCASREG
jgi:hypothetical protein